jgi:tetratricopeptide (TPR) repeat protein
MRRGVLVAALALSAAAGATAWFVLRDDPLTRLPAIALEGTPEDVSAAITQARGAVLGSPDSDEAWGNLAMVLQAHGFEPQARVCFAEAERLDAQDHRWPYLRGVSVAAADRRAALDCYRRAVALRSDLPLLRLRLAELLIDLGRLDEAQTHLRAALERQPDSPRAQLGMARVAFQRGRWQESLERASRSAAGAPRQRATHELLAQIHHRLNQPEAATQQLEILQTIPGVETNWEDPLVSEVIRLRRDPQWLALRAEALMEQGRTRESLALWEKLVSREPQIAEFHYERARALMAAGDERSAADALDEALARGHRTSEILRLRGVLHFTAREWPLAVESFRQAIELKPDDAVAHYNLGHALLKSGEEQAALEAFRNAVRCQPDYADAHTNLGKLLLQWGRRSEAVEHLERAARLAPHDATPARLLKEAAAEEP